jgi:signal peptidase II
LQPPAEDPAGEAPAAIPMVPAPADAVRDEAAAPEPAPPPEARAAGLHWWLIALVIVGDQISKAIVRLTVSLYESVSVLPGFIDITHVRNAGVAFGLLNDLETEYKWLVTTGLGLVALAGIAYYARHLRPDERIARIGLSLILGGALGNLIDRVHAGYVLDFVDVYWRGWHFWAFNVADGSITLGALCVFVDLLLVKRHVSHPV